MRILLVEDNEDLADAISRRMQRDGYAICKEGDGSSAAGVLRHQKFDLLILDIGLPRMNGLSLLKWLRGRGDATPTLMLTARDCIEDRVNALDAGADDYLGKPFDFREFQARCRVLLRRRNPVCGMMRIGNFGFDSAARRVTIGGELIELPNREYRLLEILIGYLDQVVTRHNIGNDLFGFNDDAGPNAIELYVARLRKKLVGAPLRIVTVRGAGYMLERTGSDGERDTG